MFARPFAFRVLVQPYPKTSLSPGKHSSNSTWRYFSSSFPRTKAASKISPQKQIPYQNSKPSSTPKSSFRTEETLKFAGRRPMGFAKLERKVAKEGELILFKAPSHRSYIFGAYGIAFFCFAYSVYNSNAVFRDPVVPFPMWQQGLAGGICVMMSVMGTVFLVKTGRLIKSVKAVSSKGQAYLHFTVRRVIPFQKPMEFDVLPRQIAFSRRLVISPEAIRGGQPLVSPEPTSSKTISILKAPVKVVSKALWRVFRSIRQVFTQEDFILLEVEGQKGVYRMDSAGYVSEDFLVIGNPVSLKR
ncbi:hypothetical protein BDW59DRAFT_137138 [Aspergillus cavernicola]|uniref:Uncharacterized protein n=1 Tax=Aspergillus cavernicola TaxID=176166 RepID=A0ABR4J582_9EURO